MTAGRAPELARIAASIDDVLGGRGRALAFIADAGMGKTHLLNEASSSARKRGLACAWGVGFEEGGAPAFAPVVHACRALAGRTSDDALARAAVALSTPSSGIGIDPEERRFQSFSELASSLAHVAQQHGGGVALFLDDAHAFDRGSLALLAFLAKALRADPVLLVVAWRGSEPHRSPEIDEALARLARELDVVRLAPLATDAVADLARGALGAACTPGDVDELSKRSGGNALFVVEMLARAQADPKKRLPDTIPDTVRGVIASHVAVLGADARSALEAAALVGVEVHLSTVAALLDVGPEAALARLEQSVRTGCLVDDGGLRLRFAHPLYRECVVDSIAPLARRALHAKTAASLIEMKRAAGAASTVTAHEIAHHVLGAGTSASLDDVVTWVGRAARDAMRVSADDEAAALLQRSLARVESDAAAQAIACDLLTLLGIALARTGAIATGRVTATRAAAIARSLADPKRLAAAALAHGHEIVAALVDPALIAVLEEALAALPSSDDTFAARMMRARLEARLAAARQPHVDPHVPMAMARAAIARARSAVRVSADDDAAQAAAFDEELALVLHHAGSALVEFAPAAERAPLSEETLTLAQRLGDRAMAIHNARRLVIDRLELGDVHGADRVIASCVEMCSSAAPRQRPLAPLLRAMMAHARGRFDEMRALHAELDALLADARAHGRAQGSPFEMGVALQRVLLARDAGSADELRAAGAAIARAASGTSSATPGATAASRAPLWARLFQTVSIVWMGAEPARGVLASLHLDAPAIAFGGYGASLLAEVIDAVGDVDRARALEHTPLRDWIVWSAAAAIDGMGARPSALLRSTLGHHDQAAHTLARTAASLEEIGLVVPAMRTRLDEARVRAKLDDHAQTRRAIDDVKRLVDRIGGSPLTMLRLQALADRIGPSRVTRVASGIELKRDGEVWRLSFAGSTTSCKDSRGTAMLAHLVARPNVDVTALDLEAIGAGDEGRVLDHGVGPALDDDAKRVYRARLRALEADIADAERTDDRAALARAHSEKDALAAELSRAVGKGGKDRKMASAVERARVNVQRRLKDAIERIKAVDPAAGAHLESAVKTGASCVYRPP